MEKFISTIQLLTVSNVGFTRFDTSCFHLNLKDITTAQFILDERTEIDLLLMLLEMKNLFRVNAIF